MLQLLSTLFVRIFICAFLSVDMKNGQLFEQTIMYVYIFINGSVWAPLPALLSGRRPLRDCLPDPLQLVAYVLCILRGAKISYSFEYIQKYFIVVALHFQWRKNLSRAGNSSEGRKSYFDRKEGQIFYVIWDCHRDYYRQIEYAGSVSRLSSCFLWPESLYWMLLGTHFIFAIVDSK